MKGYIDEIINKKYNTTKGYLYLIDLLKEKYPNFNVNYDNLNTLNFALLDNEYASLTGATAEYRTYENTLLICPDMINKYPLEQRDDLFINSLLHELLHCITSKKLDNDVTVEGINIRSNSKGNSLFIGLNEGITQFITNQVLNQDDLAYRFDVRLVEQLSTIFGSDFLIDKYSNNDYNGFGETLGIEFVMNSYLGHYAALGNLEIDKMVGIFTTIQDDLFELYKRSNSNNEDFYKYVFDIDDLLEFYDDEIKEEARAMLEICFIGYTKPRKGGRS